MRRRFVEFLVGRNSGPACPNFSLSVLQEFDDGTLCSDVAFHGARDLATDHGLQRRHFRDCVALTDGQGRFETYKVVDASFHNWFGLALALRDQQISDFPLCNKSFNLSYCGHDL